ncbi:hypothetical protein [Gordonia alkaliphila]|uniref:Uncharacterized protein n=1 Tax=Gordonia alkaliphila TaxID=1053547 RepID=A0ABP8Z596_9ACTN
MLTLALLATLVGFGLLVVALITANFWLAVACIIVCVVGLIILLVDILRAGRGGGSDDEPLFTIRDRESERSAPLHDASDDAPAAAQSAAVVAPPVPAEAPDAPVDDSVSGLGSLVAADPVPHVDVGDAGAPDSGALDLAEPDAPHDLDAAQADEPVTGDANDYIRSVTGSFPTPSGASPSGAWPMSAEPVPAETAASGPIPTVDSGPDTGPIRSLSPYVGRRRRGLAPEGGPADNEPADNELAADASGPADEVAPEQSAPESEAPESAAPAAQPERTFVVHDNTGPLPKITFVGDDE